MKNLAALLIAIVVCISCTEKSALELKDDNFITIQNPEYGSWQSLETPPITFEFLQAFGEGGDPDNALLANIASIFVDDNQNVYALDSYSTKLISYSKSGEIRWIIDSAGKGPGDLSQPTGIIWDKNDLIYLSNLDGARIDVFNLNGDFIKSLNFPETKEPLELIGYWEDKLILAQVVRGSFAKKFLVFNVDDLSVAKTSFTLDESDELNIPPFSNWFAETALLDGQIVYGGVSDYEYNFVELDSTKGKIVQRDFDRIIRPGIFEDDEGSMIGALGGMNPPLKLSSGHYLASANWPIGADDPDAFLEGLVMGTNTEINLGSTIDLFDRNWNLLYSIESDGVEHLEYGTPEFIDPEGNLYSTFKEPFAHIKKFKVIINE